MGYETSADIYVLLQQSFIFQVLHSLKFSILSITCEIMKQKIYLLILLHLFRVKDSVLFGQGHAIA